MATSFIHSVFPNNNPLVINSDLILNFSKYDAGGPKNFRISFVFATKDPIYWMYDLEVERDYEYAGLQSSISNTIYHSTEFFNRYKKTYTKDIPVPEPITDLDKLKDKIAKIPKTVFIYRKDKEFFVSENEHKVKRESDFYERGKLIS